MHTIIVMDAKMRTADTRAFVMLFVTLTKLLRLSDVDGAYDDRWFSILGDTWIDRADRTLCTETLAGC